jgi:hypothetical protein
MFLNIAFLLWSSVLVMSLLSRLAPLWDFAFGLTPAIDSTSPTSSHSLRLHSQYATRHLGVSPPTGLDIFLLAYPDLTVGARLFRAFDALRVAAQAHSIGECFAEMKTWQCHVSTSCFFITRKGQSLSPTRKRPGEFSPGFRMFPADDERFR